MKLISSRQTFFLKRIFPPLWYGFLAVFALIALRGMRGRPEFLLALIGPAVMAVVGYFVIKFFVLPLADEVWDAGNELIVKKGTAEVRVPLSQIANVSYERFTNPPLVTLTLREPTVLGSEIVFAPPVRFLRFLRSPVVADLIQRVDAARRR